jgi:DNA-binding MurR/RpiR family transcriptional regulator
VTKDCWQWKEQLAKVCDIAEVVRVYQDIDWNSVIERAAQLAVSDALTWSSPGTRFF